MRAPGLKSALRRWVLVPLLVAYLLILGISSWRPEIWLALDWPWLAALDQPSLDLLVSLHSIGLPPGVAVFDDTRTEAGEWKKRDSCALVYGFDGSGTPERHHPSRACLSRFKFFFPRETVMVHRLLSHARQLRYLSTPATRVQGLAEERTLSLIVIEHFRRRARIRGPSAERFELEWKEYEVSYRTGKRRELSWLLLRWNGMDDRVTPSIEWNPAPGSASRTSGGP